jgi:hypothetical protein
MGKEKKEKGKRKVILKEIRGEKKKKRDRKN